MATAFVRAINQVKKETGKEVDYEKQSEIAKKCANWLTSRLLEILVIARGQGGYRFNRSYSVRPTRVCFLKKALWV